ncbi:MAG: DUF1566 domain-containing protein [Methylococcaceae bacterium]
MKTLTHVIVNTVTRKISEMINSLFSHLIKSPHNTKPHGLTDLEKRYLTVQENRDVITLELQHEQLRLQSQYHAKKIELGLKKIQADYDKEHWVGILSRDETIDILQSSKDRHHLLMLLSEPEVSISCPDTFKHDLPMAVRNELKQFIQVHYPFTHDLYPVQFFGKFFENKVFDAHVKQYERLLASVPTVVLYSQMTDENLYLHIYGWGFGVPLTETCTLNWEEMYLKLEQDGLTEKQAYRAVRKIMIALHQALAAFFIDFYYLTAVNPLHEPHLFSIVMDEQVQVLLIPLKQRLQALQKHKRNQYQAELLNRQQGRLNQQQQIEIERQHYGVFLDKKTNLMWCRFAYGQQYKHNEILGEARTMTWHNALRLADYFNNHGGWAGYTDWRLPNIRELKTLIDKDKGKKGNYIDAEIFPNNYRFFWSSSANATYSDYAWAVYFCYGYNYCANINSHHAVRLVRSC